MSCWEYNNLQRFCLYARQRRLHFLKLLLFTVFGTLWSTVCVWNGYLWVKQLFMYKILCICFNICILWWKYLFFLLWNNMNMWGKICTWSVDLNIFWSFFCIINNTNVQLCYILLTVERNALGATRFVTKF